MTAEASARGARYLRQLTNEDLALLAACSSEPTASPATTPMLRERPQLLEALIASRSAFEFVFGSMTEERPMFLASPFLLFAAAVHRTAGELAQANYITEWFGPRQRVPIFDVSNLREFLADYERRLFLIELLASYTHISSGSVVVSTRRGFRRQRFSELDINRLASLLEALPEHDRPPVYRRLGDLALFLTGVFPDHTALEGLSSIQQARLLASVGLRPGQLDGSDKVMPAMGQTGVVELLEHLGARWYRAASMHDRFTPLAGEVMLDDLAQRFGDARRVLNVLTDSFLFPWRSRWFGIGTN